VKVASFSLSCAPSSRSGMLLIAQFMLRTAPASRSTAACPAETAPQVTVMAKPTKNANVAARPVSRRTDSSESFSALSVLQRRAAIARATSITAAKNRKSTAAMAHTGSPAT
jgi:hypothetical protein